MTDDFIHRNLRIVSIEGRGNSRRFVARPFNGDAKHWGVFDQKAGRFLRNIELEAKSTQEMREGM